MAETNPVSALLPHMTAGNCIGSGNRGTVWLIRQAETDRMVAIKRISIPVSPENVQALMFSGAVKDEAEAREYYNRLSQELVQELDAIEPLSECPNILPFQGSFLTPKENEVGYDLYLLSEYCETLRTYMEYNAMTHLRALNMSIDICTALEAYRSAGLLHRDVKPSNIFVGPRGQYMLGDLGAVRLDALSYAFIPDDQFNAYSAPETAEGTFGLNATIDTYSLGMVLYRIYNGGHAPFEDEKTGSRAAEAQRIAGVQLPAPMYADYEMAGLILKACAPDPAARFQTPGEFKQELQLYMQRNRISDDLIVPPLSTAQAPEADEAQMADDADGDTAPADSPSVGTEDRIAANQETVDAIIAEHRAQSDMPSDTQPDPQSSLRAAEKTAQARRVLVPVIIAMTAVVVFLGVFIVFIRPWDTAAPADTQGTVSTASVNEALPTMHVLSMTARVSGTDTVTVTLEADSDPAAELTVYCSDSYGNVFSQPYEAGGNTFTGLSKGVSYLFTLQSTQPLSGITQVTAVTDNTTAIEAITPSLLTDTEVQLDFSVSGVIPEEWMLVLSDTGGPIQSANFSGTAVLLKGLNPGTQYTITLSAADGAQVIGETSFSFTTEISVTLKNFTLSSMSKDSVSLAWTASGSLPEEWTVTCTAPDGTSEERLIQSDGMSEIFYTWESLASETDYTFTLACDGLKESELNNLAVTIPALSISDLAAAANNDGTATVSWTCDSPLAPGSWNVTAQAEIAGESFTQTLTVEETSAVFGTLLPGTTYTVSITTGAGEVPEGETQCTMQIPAAAAYTEHDIRVIAMVMWLRPQQETFTKNNLSQTRSSFSPSERIAFAVQASCSSGDDTVHLLYVLRDSSGSVVSLQSRDDVAWNSLWDGGIFVGSVDETPQTAGDYTLEIYIDGRLLASQDFSVR